MAQSRFEHLQEAIKAYGAAAFENLVRCKAIGDAVVAGLPDYLGCARGCVRAVPAQGAFDPREDYDDRAFSYAHRPVIVLEPVRFGVALTVQNFEDSGSLWLRTAIAVEITGETFDVFVAHRPVIRVPLNFENKLDPVFEAIYQEFLDTFKLDVLAFNDESFEQGIGFLP